MKIEDINLEEVAKYLELTQKDQRRVVMMIYVNMYRKLYDEGLRSNIIFDKIAKRFNRSAEYIANTLKVKEILNEK